MGLSCVLLCCVVHLSADSTHTGRLGDGIWLARCGPNTTLTIDSQPLDPFPPFPFGPTLPDVRAHPAVGLAPRVQHRVGRRQLQRAAPAAGAAQPGYFQLLRPALLPGAADGIGRAGEGGQQGCSRGLLAAQCVQHDVIPCYMQEEGKGRWLVLC